MSRYILKSKNKIIIINVVLITFAFIFKHAFNLELISNILFAISSIVSMMPIVIQAYQAIRVKVISIDLLVTIAITGAFIIKNFLEAAIVSFLFLFGAFLEKRTLNKTRTAIKKLIEMAPQTAIKYIDGKFVEIEVDEVEVGDLLLVKTGMKVPVDGIVIEGEGYVNEASITGEAKLAFKELNSIVYAGTILENGTIKLKTNRIGSETTFGKIIELIEEAQDAKSKVEKFIDRFSKYYTPIVLLISLITYLITLDISFAITILVLGCPGALVIGVPVANVAGIGMGAKSGVLIKGSEVMNSLSKVDTFVFDKTGTLTIGKPTVKQVKYYIENNKEVISYLVSIEKESDHPLAKAIVNYFAEYIDIKVDKREVVKGKGIIAYLNEKQVIVGSLSLMVDNGIIIDDDIKEDIESISKDGSSIVVVAIDGKVNILIGIRDQLRSESINLITSLSKLKKEVILLSGDNQNTVNAIARELGIKKAYGNMLPVDKVNFLKKLQNQGRKVAFIGDGINDSPSLAQANIGIAVGSGTDVAIETSDVVLISSNLISLLYAYKLAKITVRNMRINIFIAISVVIFLITSLLFESWMNMSIGMLVHEASILAVILNGIRILKYKFNIER